MDVESTGGDISGRRLVFLLFLSLWVATLVILGYLGIVAHERWGGAVGARLWVSLTVDLMMPFIAWYSFKAMPRNRDTQKA